MGSDASGMCYVCGKPGKVHVTEICDGEKTDRSFCMEHVPSDLRDKFPRTAAEDVALLRKHLEAVDPQVADPAVRAEFKAEIEALIADIEAGRRRFDDPNSSGH
jgi:hypothetical protein